MEKIKLIWDFRGGDAQKMAEHHEKHLKEFMKSRNEFAIEITGVESINDVYTIAFLVITNDNMPAVRDILRPHRGELYEEA